jgi:hypothetical protein
MRVGVETGRTWVFATALDWPGWCRRGKGEEAALEALKDYADRYAVVAGSAFAPGELQVVGRVPGNATTDFGAPAVAGPWDDEPLPAAQARRLVGLLDACWRTFDEVVRGAPATLAKGPRGGGRDRDAIADHVREAERSYARKVGVKLPPRTTWEQQREALRAALLDGAADGVAEPAWSRRYGLRRIAWHVLDHAWEIEDKSG